MYTTSGMLIEFVRNRLLGRIFGISAAGDVPELPPSGRKIHTPIDKPQPNGATVYLDPHDPLRCVFLDLRRDDVILDELRSKMTIRIVQSLRSQGIVFKHDFSSPYQPYKLFWNGTPELESDKCAGMEEFFEAVKNSARQWGMENGFSLTSHDLYLPEKAPVAVPESGQG